MSITGLQGMFQCSYFTQEAHIVIIMLYVVATLINFIANSLVWTAVVKNKRLQTPINYLLLSVSLSDLVAGVSVYPYLFIVDAGKIFSHPRKLARLCMFTEGLSIYFIASSVSLTVLCGISYNRFVAVRYPFKNNLRMNRKLTVVFSILAWVFCTICLVPHMITFKYDRKVKTCIRAWGQINAKAYRLFLLFAGTVIPTVFLLMSYLALIFSAKINTQIDPNIKSNSNVKLKKAEKIIGP